MGLNFALLRKKFNEEQEKLRKEYEKVGMSTEQIQEMYEYDLHQFNRDIAYFRHTQCLNVFEEADMEEGQNQLLSKFFEKLTVFQQPSEQRTLWWLDEIEDEKLLNNLIQLTDSELELIDKLAFREYSQKQISEEADKSPAAICQKLKTIRKKLKKPIRLNFCVFS